MSLRTRVESLEKALQLADSAGECVITVKEIVVRSREEVESLQRAGLLEELGDGQGGIQPPAGSVRLEVEAVEAADVLKSRNR